LPGGGVAFLVVITSAFRTEGHECRQGVRFKAFMHCNAVVPNLVCIVIVMIVGVKNKVLKTL
jgi:hypothetical protein